MSYYDGQQSSQSQSQWNTPTQNKWEHQSPGPSTPARTGASAPQHQDGYAFFYQFDEVDRAYDNLQKSGKGFGTGRHGRVSHGSRSHSHSVHSLDEYRGHGSAQGQGQNLQNSYQPQRHNPSRGSSDAEQVMQAKRRMAAQRERELRNLHTEQQYQRNAVADIPAPTNKHLSEGETRELIARQRSALYGEGQFSDKGGYIDENGNVVQGAPAAAPAPPSLRGQSPMYNAGRVPSGEAVTSSSSDPSGPAGMMDPNQRSASTTSPQIGGPTNKVFDNAIGPQSRTSNSSPINASPPRDFGPGSVAPIGTRPSGTGSASSNRATTPMNSSGGWGRGNGVWGQSSGLGAQASVWG